MDRTIAGSRKACCPNASGTAPNAWSTLATCVRPADDESERKRSNVGDIAAPSRPSAKPATTRIALDAALRRRPEGVEGEAIMVMVAEGQSNSRECKADRRALVPVDALPLEMKKNFRFLRATCYPSSILYSRARPLFSLA